MSHVPHELAEEFPTQQDLIGRLAAEDAAFAALAGEYAEINQRVHLAETYEQPLEELAEHQLRKKRVFLKDEINRRLAQA